MDGQKLVLILAPVLIEEKCGDWIQMDDEVD
jgi:hypothetical protein